MTSQIPPSSSSSSSSSTTTTTITASSSAASTPTSTSTPASSFKVSGYGSSFFVISPHDYHLAQEWAWTNRTVLAASSAAVCGVLGGFPFDSVKTRMQTHPYKSIADCARKTFAEEGLGGFFRGMIPPLVTVSIIKSISFSVYEKTKAQIRSSSDVLQGTTIPSLIGLTFLSGGVAGAVVASLSSPLELVKLQRQLEKLIAMHAKKGTETVSITGDALLRQGLQTEAAIKGHKAATTMAIKNQPQQPSPPHAAGASSWNTARQIVRQRGFMGLYKGAPLQIVRDTMGTGVYFASYETIKRLMSETITHIRDHHDHHPAGSSPQTNVHQTVKGPGPLVHFFAGGFCGIFSWMVVFPVDLIKSVLQKEVLATHPTYKGARDCAMDIVKKQGFWGLYRGVNVTLIRAFPIHAFNFLVYEAVMDFVKNWSGHGGDNQSVGLGGAPVVQPLPQPHHHHQHQQQRLAIPIPSTSSV